MLENIFLRRLRVHQSGRFIFQTLFGNTSDMFVAALLAVGKSRGRNIFLNVIILTK